MRAVIRRRWGMGLVLAGIITAPTWTLLQPERLLLPRATKIIGSIDHNNYVWLPGNRLLFLKESSDYPFTWHVYQLDLSTSRLTSYPRLAHALAQIPKGASFAHASDFQASPDGKWLLWIEGCQPLHSRYDMVETYQGVLSSIDGSHEMRFPVGSMAGIDDNLANSLYWMEDGRHIVELDWGKSMLRLSKVPNQGYGLIRDVQRPHTVRKVQISPTSGLGSGDIRVLSEHRLVAATGYVDDNAPDLIQTELGEKKTPSHRFPMPRPPQSVADEVAFSPDGERIAMVVRTHLQSPLALWVRRWFPAWKTPSRDLVGLWVARIDGSERHEIGHMDAERSPDDRDMHGVHLPEWVRWSPDGRRLSFYYKDDLYTVPTD